MFINQHDSCRWTSLSIASVRKDDGSEAPLNKKPPLLREGVHFFYSGSALLSHTVTRAVPSALESLTSVFEMGTGGTSPLKPPEILLSMSATITYHECLCKRDINNYGQAARSISTSKLNTSPCLHTWPINLVVSEGSSVSVSPLRGISYLEGGFPLRCFQRLSLPNLAIQRCSWRNNWNTMGSSIPVLSY